MEILGRGRENHALLPLTRQTRDALAKYAERRWPTQRRKHIEREWGLSPDQARAVMEATASAATIDRIFKHPRGGWTVALPVLGAVIGHGVGDFFAAEAERLRDEAAQRERDAARLAEAEQLAGDVVRSLVARSSLAAGAAAEGGRDAAVRRRDNARNVGG